MKIGVPLICMLLFITACKSKRETKPEEKLPAAASKEEVKKIITDHDFKTVKTGLFTPASAGAEAQYGWIDAKADSSGFAQEFLDKEMSLELHFNYDSTGILFYDKVTTLDSNGRVIYVPDLFGMTYKVEEGEKGSNNEGISIHVFIKRRNDFDGQMEELGTTYRVLGADEKRLLLVAPRSYRDKEVVVLMNVAEKMK